MPTNLDIDFSSTKGSKMQPNSQQQAVLDWADQEAGSLNLIARAGCGKTATLMMLVDHLLSTTSQDTIALMAYNKSASEEFKERLEKMGLSSPRVRPGTVHSFGFAAWRQVAPKVKVEGRKVDGIISSRRYEEMVYSEFGSQIAKLVSYAKQHAVGVNVDHEDPEVWEYLLEHYDVDVKKHNEEVIDAAISVYKASIVQAPDVIDFDDMILMPLLHNVNVRKYDWVMVDEAQDTNESRRLLALAMLKPSGRFVAVGDDKQAIYGFTGADSDSLDLIRNVLNSKVLPLSITYRCPKAVVEEANRLVPDLVAHESAPDGQVRRVPVVNPAAKTEADKKEAWFVVEQVTPEDVGLCRNTKPLVEEAYRMILAGVGCRVEGRDIGEGLVQLALRWKRIVSLGMLADKLEDHKAREVAKWTERKDAARVQAIEDKVQTLQVIINHLIENGSTGINDLVTHIRSLFGDTPEGQKPRVFTLSTIHKAKGREWDRVYLLHRSKTLPSPYAKLDWQLEQERNLEYVAITRAKKELVYVD